MFARLRRSRLAQWCRGKKLGQNGLRGETRPALAGVQVATMRWGKLLLVAALLAATIPVWKSHQCAVFEHDVLASANGNGFVPVQMPDGAPANTAVILAPVNCPSAAAQRADAIAKRLSEMDIPNIRTSQYVVRLTAPPTSEQSQLLQRGAVILNGQIPIVLINGMGNANPTADEVAAEYRDAQDRTASADRL
jgi:hypothetical protein